MWGDVPGWISALAVLGALGAAVYAGLTSKRLYDLEKDREKARQAQDDRRQASQVDAWAVFCPDNSTQNKDGVLIRNASGLPIYNVAVQSTHSRSRKDAAQRHPDLKLTFLPPGDFVVTTHDQYHWNFADERQHYDCVRPVTKNENWAVQGMQFTDSRGLTWSRQRGQLDPVGAAR